MTDLDFTKNCMDRKGKKLSYLKALGDGRVIFTTEDYQKNYVVNKCGVDANGKQVVFNEGAVMRSIPPRKVFLPNDRVFILRRSEKDHALVVTGTVQKQGLENLSNKGKKITYKTDVAFIVDAPYKTLVRGKGDNGKQGISSTKACNVFKTIAELESHLNIILRQAREAEAKMTGTIK